MKTNLLFATALFLSTTTFSQDIKATSKEASNITASKDNTGVSSTSSSEAFVSRDASAKIAQKANHTKTDISNEAAADKAKTKREAATSAKNTKEAIKATGNTQATVAAEGSVNTESANNKQGGEASIDGQAKVSGKETIQPVKALNHKVQTKAKATTAEAVNTTAVVKTKVINKVKVKPVTVKMQTQIKGNAGIKIK